MRIYDPILRLTRITPRDRAASRVFAARLPVGLGNAPTPVNAELRAKDVGMRLRGARRDAERLGDFFVRHPATD